MFFKSYKAVALLSFFVTTAAAQAEVAFRITDVFMSKTTSSGETPYTPLIGETYRITVKYDVLNGPAKASYQVLMTLGGRDLFTEVTNLGLANNTLSFDYSLPLDGQIAWEVEIDPWDWANGEDKTKRPAKHNFPDPLGGGSSSTTTGVRRIVAVSTRPGITVMPVPKKTGFFTPRMPTKAVEYYSPRYYVGALGMFFDIKAGSNISRMVVMTGSPTTDSWQKKLYDFAKVESPLGDHTVGLTPSQNTSAYPVHIWDKANVPVGKVSVFQQYVVELKNVRVNKTMLNGVSWSQIDALQGLNIFKFYSQPEDVIQSNHTKVKQFVTNTLGSNYRNNYTPYAAARKLFQAVLKHCTYYFPQEGQPDLRAQNAVELIDKRQGDCGSFSMLLVALFRQIGIPSRTACGAWKGQDAGHCWSEMYFPTAGWILSDGSLGNGLSESGDFAYYFGNMGDLNARYANMRGNTFNVNDIKTSWLQCPYGPSYWGSGGTQNYVAHTALVEITKNQADDFGGGGFSATSAKPKALWDAFRTRPMPLAQERLRCPCHSHGGFQQVRLNLIARKP